MKWQLFLPNIPVISNSLDHNEKIQEHKVITAIVSALPSLPLWNYMLLCCYFRLECYFSTEATSGLRTLVRIGLRGACTLAQTFQARTWSLFYYYLVPFSALANCYSRFPSSNWRLFLIILFETQIIPLKRNRLLNNPPSFSERSHEMESVEGGSYIRFSALTFKSILNQYSSSKLRSCVLFSEERESVAERESTFPTADSCAATLSRSSEKRTHDRRLFKQGNTFHSCRLIQSKSLT